MPIIAEEVVQTRQLIVYTQPYSAANAMPANSAWGTAWGGSWVDKGATDGGLNVNMAMTYEDVSVDQVTYPIYSIGTAGDIHLVTNLAQLTAANIKEAAGGQGTISTSAASSGVRGHTDLAINGDISVNFLTTGYDIRHPGDGESLRPVLWKAQARGSLAMTFLGTGKAVLAYDAQGYPDTANGNRLLTWRDVIAALP